MMGAIRLASRAFRVDWQWRYQIVEINPALIEEAMALAERHYLRGYDAVHLAAALEVQQVLQASELPPLTFVSADVEQLQAAQVEGLQVDNPNSYI